MANQAHSGIEGVPWHRCQRCGTDQRTSNLVWQLGLLLCTSNDCVDNLDVQLRPGVISSVLADGPDAPPAPILQDGPEGDLAELQF